MTYRPNPQFKFYASRLEWETARTSGIGASEVGTILGVNKWESPHELWSRKTGRTPPKPMTTAMKMGHLLEPIVASLFFEAEGGTPMEGGDDDFTVFDTDNPWLRVSPDRLYRAEGETADAPWRVLECKTTQTKIDPDDLPLYWFAQLQYQMAVVGATHGALAWLENGRDFGYKLMTRDDEFCSMMIESVNDFWLYNCFYDNEPPLTTPEDYAAAFPQSLDKETEADDALAADCRQLFEIKERIHALSDQKDAIESRIKMAFADAERLTYHGRVLATYKSAKPAMRLNGDLLKFEQPDIYKQYLKPAAASRRLLIKATE